MFFRSRFILEGAAAGDHVLRLEQAILGDHHRLLVAVLDVDRHAIEVGAVFLEDVGFGAVADRLGGNDEPLRPLLDRDAELDVLAWLELPLQEAVLTFFAVEGDSVGKRQVEVERSRVAV